ncbi:YgzB family protein [Paenibacillus tyrfis]|uniref:YgzB family protein n=1 Tax=Paenibacillus tyrfis TaxID=1501230 RepID=UPI00209F7ABA|nr:YgzB family protein [Paenibacillus tyrfis]MCP1309976.1 YgzB family protein [Paenibacillus tyrfis]
MDRPAIEGVVIVLAFLLFFPAGLLLAAIRLWKHRDLSYQKIDDWRNAGATFLVLFVLLVFIFLFLNSISPADTFALFSIWFILIIFLFTPGVSMLWVSKQSRKQLFIRYDHYRHIVMSEGITSVHTIAEMIWQRPAVVANDLKRLIGLGEFPNAYLDMNSMAIVFQRQVQPTVHSDSPQESTTEEDFPEDLPKDIDFKRAYEEILHEYTKMTSSSKTDKKPLPKTVECPGCGSSTLLQPGESKACAYCDSPLTYSKSE